MMPWVQVLLRFGKGQQPPPLVSREEFDQFLERHDRDMQVINEMVAAIQREPSEEQHG